jgi:hypothetical protein
MVRWRNLALAALALSACDDATAPDDGLQRFAFDFDDGTQGWEAGFADYPVGEDEEYELDAAHEPLPDPLDQNRGGFRLTGYNYSDDLLMYLKRPIDDLEPNRMYRIAFDVEFATAAPSGCSGTGGAPGESVFVKAGASDVEPVSEEEDGYNRINIDIGNQAEDGEKGLVLGDIANSNTNCDEPVYELKELTSDPQVLTVQADDDGRLWLIVGIDSGFESLTSLWFSRVDVRLSPAEPQVSSK